MGIQDLPTGRRLGAIGHNRWQQDSSVLQICHSLLHSEMCVSECFPVSEKPVCVAYLRVSTAPQGESGLGREAQQATVEAFAKQQGGAILATCIEVESGKRSDRPELAKALGAARKGKATLLIAKLDRLARNVAFIATMMEAGVDFVACDQPFASRLTLHILAAEDEARRISERTKAALAAAKARGTKLDSPTAIKTVGKARAARSAYAAKANETTRIVIRDIQASGVKTLASIARALQARGIKTPAGRHEWRPVQVSRLLAA
jgi:DNA invertase Pin-like site-specific DNA recombinase